MPETDLDTSYARLEKVLRGIALRLRLLTALEWVLQLTAIVLIILLGSIWIRETRNIGSYLPFIYCVLAVIALVSVFLLGLWRIASGRDMVRIARGLEERYPRLKDDVTNALLLSGQVGTPPGADPLSKGLIRAHLRKTADSVSDIRPQEMVSFRKVFSYAKLLIPLFVAFTTVFALEPHFLNRSLALILHPLSALPDRKTFIAMEPAPAMVLRGTPMRVAATTTGYIPDRLSLTLWPDEADLIRLDMVPEGNGRFTHRIPSAQTSFRYQAAAGRDHTPIYRVQVVDAPAIGKLKLTLIPPGYTRLSRETSDQGHIEALKGTIVHLAAQATKPVTEGRLVLNQKDQLLLTVEGDRLTGNLFVTAPGVYSLSIRDALGFENADPVQYRIHLIPDKYPEGEIISPPENLEVSGREVLPVLYAARDDFGVTTVRLNYQVRGTERSIVLKRFEDNRSIGPEHFRWDLSMLALVPGDRVAYRIEVWDNDSISGPKAGYSKTFSLFMQDEKDRAARNAEHIQEITGALLDLLADHLEEVKDRKALSEDIAGIMEKVDRHLERMGTEKIERFDMESLKRNLATLHRGIDSLPRESITQEMERLALLAEDLVKKTRMHEVEALTREIKNRHSRLLDALRDSKAPFTPEDLQALLKELDKLKDLISQVMEALSKMAAQLPDEFINSPELKDLEFQDLFSDLEEIQKKLMAGDLEGALQTAQKLLETLSKMMAAMAGAGAQAGMGAFDRLRSEMSRQAGELEKILEAQREILAGTESIDRELKHAIEAEAEKRLNAMMSRLKETLVELHRRLPSEEKDSVTTMERLLEERRVDQLSRLAETLAEAHAGDPDVQALFRELMQLSKTLTPDPQEALGTDSRKKFPDLSLRQKKLGERTRNLGKTLETLSQLFPGMDTEIINNIKDAAGSMGKASEKLGEQDAAGAIPPEQEAIQRLARSQQGMRQTARQIAQHMQGNQWGYPWGYDPRAGWYYGPWGPMPTLPQPDVTRPLERGYTGIDREEFDPPAKDAYRAPERLRERVMEAMKEEIPAQYRKEVERYFRGLTQ